MALQTNVLENGTWVTRNVDALELFRQSRSSQAKAKQQPSIPPTYGVLTQTIVDSPLVRWVLPVQLRSSRQNDIAFIGDNFVQICELRPDLRLQDVVKKHDFGSRIRNARVIGTAVYRQDEDTTSTSEVKREDDDIEMADSMSADTQQGGQYGQLPPQFLALVLERGDLIFFYIKEGPAGELSFISSTHEIPDSPVPYPGYHMAVNPSFRYLTLACSENLFIIYELESMETLRARHIQGQKLNPVRYIRPRAINGIIHKIEFLYPRPNDDYHVILMLIIVHKEVARLVTYDWEQGDNLKKALEEEKSGYRIEPKLQLAHLIIPLTVCSGFFLVTEDHTAVCLDPLIGPPTFDIVDLEGHDDTTLHLGNRRPIWTAWSRPPRVRAFLQDRDVIYLGREDGVISFLEFNETGLTTGVIMGTVECNIDTAFGTIGEPHDILIIGGDSGPGGIWQVKARKPLEKAGNVSNWSPANDFVIASISPRSTEENRKATKNRRHADLEANTPLRPDRIFSCSGRGKSGSITEYRYGLEAKIGLEFDCQVPVRRCWAMPLPSELLDELNGVDGVDGGLCLLLALPNRTDMVYIPNDFNSVAFLSQDQVPYDLSSITLAAGVSQDAVFQVTTGSITVITSTKSIRHLCHELDDGLSADIVDAAINNNTVALSLYSGSQFQVKSITMDGLNFVAGPTFPVEGEVTCLALGNIGGHLVMMAGIWRTNACLLAIYPTGDVVEGSSAVPITLDLRQDQLAADPMMPSNGASASVEALTSIVVVEETQSITSLAIGTKSGEVFTVILDSTVSPPRFQQCCEKFGLESTCIFPFSTGTEPPAVFACSNSGLTVMTNYVTQQGRAPRFTRKFRVWPTDTEDSTMSAPVINSVMRIPQNLSEDYGDVCLLISGSVIYISELQSQPKPVPRQLRQLGRTPLKMIYSRRLGALVVAVSTNRRPSIVFLDPETGDDLSVPTDPKGNETPHILGLGEEGTTILAMTEWSYHKGGKNFEFIVIAMSTQRKQGQLIVVSAENTFNYASEEQEDDLQKVRYYTRARKAYPEPIYSVATEEQGLFLCVGNTVHYDVLDSEEKKLKMAKKHDIGSPAPWMKVLNGNLYAATSHHSLEVIDYKSDPRDDTMTRLYTDDHAKRSLHFIEAATEPNHPIVLLSDTSCGLWGVWVPAQDSRPLQTVFQADLQASVRRFAQSRARPQWDSLGRKIQYGCIPSSADGSDIIGLSIDGSLRHFTLLNADAWRLLRFIQNLALMSSDLCPFEPSRNMTSLNPEPQPRPLVRMQVDGDILQRCLDSHALEELILETEYETRFRQLLDALDSGNHTRSFGDSVDLSKYFELAYDILEYYLAPLL